MPPRKKTPNKAQKSKWTADTILSDPNSPLASSDLRSILSNPEAWTSLTIQDRQEVLALFPEMTLALHANTEEARPNFELLMNDDSFRYDCAAYVENLAQGRHDPQWLSDAWSAHVRRKDGEFDEFLEDKFEKDWGIPIPEEMKRPKRSRKSPIDLKEEERIEESREVTQRVEPEVTDDIHANSMAPVDQVHQEGMERQGTPSSVSSAKSTIYVADRSDYNHEIDETMNDN